MGDTVGVVRVDNAARLEALRHLEAELRRPNPAGTAAAHSRGELAGRALAAAGDLLRRTGNAGTRAPELESVLRLLPGDAVDAWSRAMDFSELDARLRRAAEEAVEAAVPESPEDRDTWAAWAKEGLRARDRLESQLVALRHRESLGFEADRPARERVAQAVERQDRALRSRSRWFVALNPWRRSERDALDPAHRAQAWWFGDRAECDDLLPLLAGEALRSPHLEQCEDCRRDLASVAAVARPRARHLSEEELWNLDLGLVSAQDRAIIDAHVRGCGECARAVGALEEGEEIIRELTASQRAPVNQLPAAPRAVTAGDPEIVAEHADFRLLVFRRRERTRVVVQPRREGRVAAAAVFVAEDPRQALSARPGPEGLELEVGESLRVRGAARIRVRLTDARDELDYDVKL